MENTVNSILSELEFVAIDTETTGLNKDYHEIIEIAAIRFKNGEEVARFDSFVKPKGIIPKFIEHLTHITPHDLKNAPPIREVLKDFSAFIGNSILVGHNLAFDLGFINAALIKSGDYELSNQRWDTAELGRIYLPETNDHKLTTLAAYFGIDLQNAHRADADAYVTGKLLLELTQHAVKHHTYITNARLLDLVVQANRDDNLDEYFKRLVRYQRSNALNAPPIKTLKSDKHNIIDHKAEGTIGPLDEVFGMDGIFARKFSNYEFRAGQLDMANQVEEAFQNSDHLVVEAGTGVGKSFAYLVPALKFSQRTKSKVVVSTNTKNLQEQLFYKDLPQLREMLPLPFKAVLVKGRENYVCERRWDELLNEQTRGLSSYDAQALLYLFVWKLQTNTGDVSENSSFDRKRFGILWRRVCSDRFSCYGRKCPHFASCRVMTLRKEIETANVVVANHSLMLADAQIENSTLGEYQYLIIDEAHNLMDSASQNLGFELGYSDLNTIFNQLSYNTHKLHSGFLPQLMAAAKKSIITDAEKTHLDSLCNTITGLIDEQKRKLSVLFNATAQRCAAADNFGKHRIKETASYTDIYEPLQQFMLGYKEIMKSFTALGNVLDTFNGKKFPNLEILKETHTAFTQRMSEAEIKLLTILNPNLDNYALWIENSPRSERNIPTATFCYAPVEVGAQLNALLYKPIPCIIFTSATLAIRGSFKYFNNRSGLALVEDKNVRESIVESPFDYDKQSLLLISSFLPEHKDKFFQNQALGCLEQVVDVANVGTMALFTSYKDLDTVYEHLSDKLYHANRPFYAQGKGGSRSSILEDFKKSKNAVLLGTSSFWEGVDVVGDSLSLLILYKLPFQVPSDPLVEALIDKLEREEKDSFMHFMLPNALLRLRQGFGRLIRSKTDRGIVLIMDSRVSRKRYGQYFKQILPGRSLELRDEQQLVSEIGKFFNKI